MVDRHPARHGRSGAASQHAVRDWIASGEFQVVTACLAADPAGPGLAVPGIRVCEICKGGSALRRAATPRAYKGAAGEKTSNKIDTILVGHGCSRGRDSLLSPITAAADRSESTTLLVAKVCKFKNGTNGKHLES